MALTGERKALAAAILSLYALFFLVNALMSPDQEFTRFFAAMSAMYGMAFFALVAGYFWARWFAIGVGIYGLIGGVMAIWQIGLDYVILFYGGTHALVSLILWGNKMATDFDGRSDWRERYHMDENATRRLGKAVIRVGVSLPILLAYGLAPRAGMVESLMVMAAVGVAGLGIFGLLRLRTWGIVAMVAGAAAILATMATTGSMATTSQGVTLDLLATGTLAALLLLAAAAPFAGPMVRYLRR
jgi:hypothetical protein